MGLDALLDARPLRTRGFRLDRRGERLFLSDGDGSHVCRLNESAAAVWELCDGRTTVAEMVDAVCLACNVDRADAIDDLRRVVTELVAGGLVEWPDGGDATPGERA